MIPRVAIPIRKREFFLSLIAMIRAREDDVEEFEKDLAGYLGAKKIYATNSGRTALYLALKSLNLKTGAGVIVPAYTCPIVFEVILRLRLKPILVDVDPKTYNINPELIPKAVTPETRVIIPIHLFGRPCKMSQIMEIANKLDLLVIENAAQALGAKYNGKKVGTFGNLSIFSFGPGKSITSGEGGALAVNDDEICDKIENLQENLPKPSLSWQIHVMRNIIAMKIFSNPMAYNNIIRKLVESEIDKNESKIVKNCIDFITKQYLTATNETIRLMRMPPLSAKMARMQLKKIDYLNKIRILNSRILLTALKNLTDYIQLPEPFDRDAYATFTRFPVKIRRKDIYKEVIKNLKGKGIDMERPYHNLISFIRNYSSINSVHYVHAEDLCQSLITIPNHPSLNSYDIIKISHLLIQSMRVFLK